VANLYSHLLDKPLNNYDISVFENYGPDTILDYHHHSEWEVSLNTYWMLKEKHQNSENPNPFLEAWVNFFDEVLGAGNDLQALQGAGLVHIGPYYHPATNTTVYFTSRSIASEPVTAADVGYLLSLAEPPLPNVKITKYHKNLRKYLKQVGEV
jgi:hypothetical protein